MTRYVRVMDKDVSNASGKIFNVNDITVSSE